MARTALPRRLIWRPARVVEVIDETPRCHSIVLDIADWRGHRAGQHVDVRLTAEDGYQAQRSYSIASAPEDRHVMLTVERLEDGEVSPYLVDELRPGDEFEVRGPVGGYFVWERAHGGPLLLTAGGSGVVPLRAMLLHWAAGERDVPVRLIYSARSPEDVIYQRQLAALSADRHFTCEIALTRRWPENWQGHRGRIDRRLLDKPAWTPAQRPLVYVCGPTAFVEAVADTLVAAGHDPGRIRTERFGATGT